MTPVLLQRHRSPTTLVDGAQGQGHVLFSPKTISMSWRGTMKNPILLLLGQTVGVMAFPLLACGDYLVYGALVSTGQLHPLPHLLPWQQWLRGGITWLNPAGQSSFPGIWVWDRKSRVNLPVIAWTPTGRTWALGAVTMQPEKPMAWPWWAERRGLRKHPGWAPSFTHPASPAFRALYTMTDPAVSFLYS